MSAIRRGPVEGFYAVAKVIGSAVLDLANTSVRRTFAMAMLAVQESIRRKVLIAFAVFIVVLLFAGWYLDVKSDNPGRLYLSFVLTSSNYLVLILALFLSTFSLPADIKNRTIYTIVTKPRAGNGNYSRANHRLYDGRHGDFGCDVPGQLCVRCARLESRASS